MLTEEEHKEIQTEIEQYPYSGAACLDALKIVQNHRGWISDDAVKDIAQTLGLSNEEAAAALDMPLGTLKSHVNRGREKLAALLDVSRIKAVS